MLHLFRLVRLILVIGVLLFITAIVSGFGLYYYFSRDLPRLDSLKDYNPPVVSEVYSADGTKIGEFWTEKRFVLSPKEMPKTMVQAIVASEDDRFFEHKGIDYQSIVRAFFENLKAGHVVQGGSTITQQITKSLLLSSERTINRKIKEAILATRIEKNFNKEEILNLYLNQTFFGNRAYGVEAASRNYFHKTCRELNIAEAALIAGLAKAPSLYSPITNPAQAKERQEYVIDRMFEVGFITKEQREKARAIPLKVYRAETDKEFNDKYTPWFTEYIRRTIQEKYGEQVPYTHGLQIYTTVDPGMQKAADRAVERGIRELDKRQGYAGPIQKIPEADISKFAAENHLAVTRETLEEEWDYFHPLSDDELTNRPTPIIPGRYYRAVVTKVDRQGQNLEVLVGNVSGIIRVHDYAWARKRNLNSAGYNDVYYIRDPGGTFSVGDVIWVKKKIPGDDAKGKGYEAGKNYFSLEQEPEVAGALFSYEPQSGFVRAIVGGLDFKKSEFNRAMQAIRQTGSAIKPLIYSAALDKGYSLSTVIEDAPLFYEYAPGRFWSPQNYGGGFKGPTTFRSGLVNSRNVVTVRILMDIGVEYVDAYARKLGITTPINRYYSMALGANDMKLYELSRAYGVFPNGGILPELVFVKRITDRYGRVLEEYRPRQIVPFTEQLAKNRENRKEAKEGSGYSESLLAEGEKWIADDKLKLTEIEKRILYGDYVPEGYVISPRTAYTMVQLMNDVVNYGTGYKVRALGRPAAGKTGTTNDETDTWFVGYVPDLFAGVWVGFDKVQKIGSRETGGNTSAPIFLYYMQEVLKGKPVANFEIPKEINTAVLDAPIDLTAGDAEAGGIEGGGSSADFFIYDF
ncbi:MAG: PBP1A family penicillin-binding protein [Deltaproteobacteria bacterium]|nr:PBP1A family penicillin-binding protein [Deltaproteobacteria bacterium]